VPELFIHTDAENDLNEIWEEHPDKAAIVIALIEQLQCDEDLLERLTERGYGAYESEAFHVDGWFDQWRQERNLWRLSVVELNDLDRQNQLRIIYAFIPAKQRYYILAIAPRSFNYDREHSITKRIIRAYDDL